MIDFIKDPVFRFRMIAFVEGCSYLLLLFVSMPLKYYMGFATFSWYVGMAHGVLFVIYILFAVEIFIRRRIGFIGFIRVVIASIIPFGTFFNDAMLKKHELRTA